MKRNFIASILILKIFLSFEPNYNEISLVKLKLHAFIWNLCVLAYVLVLLLLNLVPKNVCNF